MGKIKKTVMLLTALFCLQLCLYSQTVNLNLRNVPVREAIAALQEKSGYSFVFENSDLNTGKSVSVNANDLKGAISQILAGQDVSYKINGKNIIVYKNGAKSASSAFEADDNQGRIPVSGKVLDTKGQPIIQASVVKKGTSLGVVADIDGNFKFTVDKNAVLEVSCLGYVSQTVPLNGKTSVTVVLHEDLQSIEETVVVGYATQKKANLTGAVTTVDVSKDINNRTSNNLSDLLAGTAAGLTSIASNQGSRPGANSSTLKIRGTGTTNNADPLVVVDGFISSIDNVNPADVENISVLKDAASSSIYGSRAANGVILVTTKKGKSGQAKVSLNATYSLQRVGHTMDIVSNYADYMEYINEGFTNQGYKPTFTPHVDCGDNVIIINAAKVVFTGKKETDKVYTRYTGYPGGQRFNTPAELRKRPDGMDKILRHAIKGMLPKGPLGRSLMDNLFIYDGTEHKHEAQQPKAIDINQYK